MLKENKLDRGIQVFENPILDHLSRANPWLPLLFWGPIAVASVAYGVFLSLQPTVAFSALHALWLVPAGVFLWSFAEYWLHRSFFHFKPRAVWLRKTFYWVHEHHHQYQERDRLVAPLMMSLPIAAAFVALFWAVSNGAPWVFPLFAGFILGYLAYDYTHFATHFIKTQNHWIKERRRKHLQHHFAYPNRWYGVSSPFWDYVFGTYVKSGERSKNAKPNRKIESHEEVWVSPVPELLATRAAKQAARTDGPVVDGAGTTPAAEEEGSRSEEIAADLDAPANATESAREPVEMGASSK